MQTLQMHNSLAIDVAELSVSLAPAETGPPKPDNITPEKTNAWAAAAQQVTITDQTTYNYAVELLQGAKALLAEAETHHRETIKKAYEAHRSACDMLNRVNRPIEEAERIIKAKIGAWDMAQRRLKEEADRKQREIEAQRAAEQAEREIEAAEAAGAKPEEVREIIREVAARPIIVPQAAPTYQRAKGISITPTLKGRVDDMRKVVAFVAANPAFLSLLEVSDSRMAALIKAMGKNFVVPGITLVEDVSVGARRKA